MGLENRANWALGAGLIKQTKNFIGLLTLLLFVNLHEKGVENRFSQ